MASGNFVWCLLLGGLGEEVFLGLYIQINGFIPH